MQLGIKRSESRRGKPKQESYKNKKIIQKGYLFNKNILHTENLLDIFNFNYKNYLISKEDHKPFNLKSIKDSLLGEYNGIQELEKGIFIHSCAPMQESHRSIINIASSLEGVLKDAIHVKGDFDYDESEFKNQEDLFSKFLGYMINKESINVNYFSHTPLTNIAGAHLVTQVHGYERTSKNFWSEINFSFNGRLENGKIVPLINLQDFYEDIKKEYFKIEKEKFPDEKESTIKNIVEGLCKFKFEGVELRNGTIGLHDTLYLTLDENSSMLSPFPQLFGRRTYVGGGEE